MKIKVNGVRNLHDARYFSAMGVDLLGFNLGRTEAEKLTVQEVAEIMIWISGPLAVAEFGHEPVNEIINGAAAVKAEFVSLPIDYPRHEGDQFPVPVILRCDELPADLLRNRWAGHRLPVYFEMNAAAVSHPVSDFYLFILVADSANTALQLANTSKEAPFAVTLGDFSLDAEGQMDYDACDSFFDRLERQA